MKKLLWRILPVIMLTLMTSCGDNKTNEPEYDIVYHANIVGIQGIWRHTNNAQYHDFYFNGNTYHIEVNNAINIGYEGGPVRTEDGDFMLVDDTMTFYPYEGESYFSNSKATVYWEDAKHTRLMIMPIGVFVPYTPQTSTPNVEEES